MKASVEISIEGFSGPLDLLCHLVESRQMQASSIKMAQLVRIYGAYLSKTQKAAVETLAEFFFMVAGLLLQKALSLLPNAEAEESSADDFEELPIDEEEFLERLSRYRPYRTATAWLEERKARQDRCFRRIPAEDSPEGFRYDIGDLYFLSRIWWGLFDRYVQKRGQRKVLFDFPDEEWDGMPEAVPEEAQIQSRIAELEEKLRINSVLYLNALWSLAPSVNSLVVTLLAVLEMCRMGKASVEQEKLFGDVKICAKN